MIVKENGLRYAKLVHVSVDNGMTDNSNKVYIMEELSDGRIKCDYGRVGKNMTTVYKSKHEWDKILREKTSSKKGYTDVTELLAEPVVDDSKPTNNKVDNIKDSIVRKLVDELMSYANKSIQRNYKVTQESVSEQQVNAAQEIINSISGLLVLGVDKKHINDMLLKLYTIIPRRMDNVKNHLIDEVKTNDDLERAQKLIGEEQSTLDTMAGQVELLKQQKEAAKKAAEAETNGSKEEVEEVTILDQMGLSIEIETDTDKLELIKKLMGPNVNQMKRVFKVVNKKTQVRFDKNYEKASVKKKRYYWHGSRNENWFNILQTGLLIRPSGAVHTGSMWDDGIYFASDSDKSLGYTNGGRWTGGSRNGKVFLGLFDVHVGNQLHKYKHDSSCYTISKEVKSGGFDSVHAHKGDSLRKDEYIVYRPEQCTISHLIEIGG